MIPSPPIKNDARVEIVPYDPNWPLLFEMERRLLEPVLAQWLAGPIEHVGSTSVPGLAAKPVIDIMAGVVNLEGSRPAIELVKVLEYQYAPYHPDTMHWFCKPGPALRTHHLHLVPYGSQLWKDRLKFRDALRADADIAHQYAELKRELALQFPEDREAYGNAKGSFIRATLSRWSGLKCHDPKPH
jgi:GrpB-like predicted nucleotidyltransferase (UPF0157 family)